MISVGKLIVGKILLEIKISMGKKKITKFEVIRDPNQRKVCLSKRKKGLLKKAIQLSALCDLDIFIHIHDKLRNRVTHFASNEDSDLLAIFNQKSQREFFSNCDYGRLGGSLADIDCKHASSSQSFGTEANSDDEEVVEGVGGGGVKSQGEGTKIS